MDNAHQALNGEPFNLHAYGLVYALLDAGVPLHWAITAGKSKDAIDFSADCSRLFPTALATSNQNFRASAFVIDANDIGTIQNCGGSTNLFVDDIIIEFGNSVAVYLAEQSFTADVRHLLTNAPVIAILDDGGFSETGYDLLEFVDIPYTLISYPAFAQNNGCYTMIAQPHLGEDDVDAAYAAIVTNFLNNGGNFFAQCAAVQAFEENANYLTTTGFTYFAQNIMDTGISYENNDMPVMQFEGEVLGFGVGSVSNFALENQWLPHAYPGISGTLNRCWLPLGITMVFLLVAMCFISEDTIIHLKKTYKAVVVEEIHLLPMLLNPIISTVFFSMRPSCQPHGQHLVQMPTNAFAPANR
jgi:hypothetical protein